jgi:hypothetical protein
VEPSIVACRFAGSGGNAWLVCTVSVRLVDLFRIFVAAVVISPLFAMLHLVLLLGRLIRRCSSSLPRPARSSFFSAFAN